MVRTPSRSATKSRSSPGEETATPHIWGTTPSAFHHRMPSKTSEQWSLGLSFSSIYFFLIHLLYIHDYKFITYRDRSYHVDRSKFQVGVHCVGHNPISIGICYIGELSFNGKHKNPQTPQQHAAMLSLRATSRGVPRCNPSWSQRVCDKCIVLFI